MIYTQRIFFPAGTFGHTIGCTMRCQLTVKAHERRESMSSQLFALAAMVGALFMGVISPGPSFVMVARTSMSSNRSHGIAASVGMGFGGVFYAVAALLGLQLVFNAVPALFLMLKFVGGAYLIWLGIKIWRASDQPLWIDGAVYGKRNRLRKSLLLGLSTQLRTIACELRLACKPNDKLSNAHSICSSTLQDRGKLSFARKVTLMLKLKPTCENCNQSLPPHSTEARICSYECTFCVTCVSEVLQNVCPNCGGGFVPRPIRPVTQWRSNVSVEFQPGSSEIVHKPVDVVEHAEFAAKIAGVDPKRR